jgi:hypothetical protein
MLGWSDSGTWKVFSVLATECQNGSTDNGEHTHGRTIRCVQETNRVIRMTLCVCVFFSYFSFHLSYPSTWITFFVFVFVERRARVCYCYFIWLLFMSFLSAVSRNLRQMKANWGGGGESFLLLNKEVLCFISNKNFIRNKIYRISVL